MSYLEDRKSFPNKPHFAIIKFGTISQPGYDKGDPSYDVTCNDYLYFTDKKEWEAEITKMTLDTGYGRKEFVAFTVNPVEISTTVSVSIKS